MSLAQRVERPPVGNAGPSQAAATAIKAAVPVDFRDITRRAVQPPHVTVIRGEAPGTARKESEAAFELLNEVAKAFPVLMERCEKLDAALSETKDLARVEIEASNDVAREWQQIAGALKLQVDGLEKGLKAMKQRAEAAEQQAASLRETADKSQHAAAEAECLSSLFQEKVISSFGSESPLHPLLETFRFKPAVVSAP